MNKKIIIGGIVVLVLAVLVYNINFSGKKNVKCTDEEGNNHVLYFDANAENGKHFVRWTENGQDIDMSGMYIYTGANNNFDLDEYIDRYINDSATTKNLTCDWK